MGVTLDQPENSEKVQSKNSNWMQGNTMERVLGRH